MHVAGCQQFCTQRPTALQTGTRHSHRVRSPAACVCAPAVRVAHNLACYSSLVVRKFVAEQPACTLFACFGLH